MRWERVFGRAVVGLFHDLDVLTEVESHRIGLVPIDWQGRRGLAEKRSFDSCRSPQSDLTI
jgi:hypothetical protein